MKFVISLLLTFAFIAILAAISLPRPLTTISEASWPGDSNRGKRLFDVTGCAFCHADPKAAGNEMLVLSGGRAFLSKFGTFYAPNISPDPEFGIGGWNNLDFVNALQKGLSPEGQHYYPVFPYDSFLRMSVHDIIDIKAYLFTLPPSKAIVKPHELPFFMRSRRSLGLWKAAFLREGAIIPVPQQIARGQYLVEGPGFCADCHTPRNFLGGMKHNLWLSGNFDGVAKMYFPNLTPHADGLKDWSVDDIAHYLKTGIKPNAPPSKHGVMAEIIENTMNLTDADRQAIAAYLKSIPAISGTNPHPEITRR